MKELMFIGLMLMLSLHIKAIDVKDKAYWITASENQNATNTWLCFRKNFILPDIPEEANTRIAVDSKYWLWVNGKLVVFEGGVKRGPNPHDIYYDTVDIAKYLKKGDNVIALLLWYFGKSGFSHNSTGLASLFFDCNIDNSYHLISNTTWKSIVHPAYFTPALPVPNYRLSESNIGYDARFEINDWIEPDSRVDNNWANAKIIGSEGDLPWGNLHHRVIPLWRDYGLRNYKRIELKQGITIDTLVCWLPFNTQITPYLKIEAEAGERIEIKMDNYKGGGPYNVRAEYITTYGIQEYESLGWMNGHQVRYLIPKKVKVVELKYRETTYNSKLAGSFDCNDNSLNILWTKACRTLLVTMRDTYMDCPDRERAQWWGDVVNESGEAFYALDSNSHLLMKKGMYELIGWQRKDGSIYSPIPSSNWDKELPEQMLAAIGKYGFWNYYMNTGDKKTIVDLYEGVKKYLNIWNFNEDGSIQFRKSGWNWGDWGTNIDKEGLYNAWYYMALQGAKNMANLLGKDSDIVDYDCKMAKLKMAFNSYFWTGSAYRHNNYKNDTDDRLQALAVVSGLADKDRYPDIFKVLKTQEYASPYMEKYVTEALFLMGYESYALERMKRRFSNMINDDYHTTLYEGWEIGNKDFGGGSSNHAWSGGGLTIMSQYICGIAPIEPGYSSFSVLPQPAGLKYAKSKVCTVKGDIEVGFMENKDTFSLTLSVPNTTSAIAGVPRSSVKEVLCNNQVIWKKGKYFIVPNADSLIDNSSFIKFKLSAGTWTLIAKK